jgi:uncharacterized protein with NRDE domain
VCTLILHWQPDAILLLANRDERLDRAAEGWSLRTTRRGTRILAPRDLTALGTWVGINVHGLVVAITNHHTGTPPDPARISRGQLVEDMLDQPDALTAKAAVSTRNAAAHNPFHLVVADRQSAFLWHLSSETAALEDLTPGLHVVTESHAHGVGHRGNTLRQAFRPDLTPAQARDLLAAHHEDPRAAVCVHLGEVYGTRSSVMLAPQRGLLMVADARPCTTPWTDVSPLLSRLMGG